MNPEDRAALREKAEKATPGPWHVADSRNDRSDFEDADGSFDPLPEGADVTLLWQIQGGGVDPPSEGWKVACGYDEAGTIQTRPADLTYIAAAHPAAILSLLADIERAETFANAGHASDCAGLDEAAGVCGCGWLQRERVGGFMVDQEAELSRLRARLADAEKIENLRAENARSREDVAIVLVAIEKLRAENVALRSVVEAAEVVSEARYNRDEVTDEEFMALDAALTVLGDAKFNNHSGRDADPSPATDTAVPTPAPTTSASRDAGTPTPQTP